MSSKQRQDFLDDFSAYLRERAASGITVVEVNFRKKDWQDALTNILINNPVVGTILPDVLEKHAADSWDDFSNTLEKWVNSRKRPKGNISYYAINNKRSHKFGKDRIVIKLKGRRAKTSGKMKGRTKGRVAGKPSPAWIDNAINGMKKYLKKNVKKFNMPKVITAEHGSLPEGEQAVGQGRFVGVKRRNSSKYIAGKTPVKRPGALGNNASNAAIQALGDAIDRADSMMDIYGMYIADFFRTTYTSNVTKKKDINKFVAEHKATLTIMPGESPENKGALDSEDIASFRHGFEEAAKHYFSQKHPTLSQSQIDKMFASSSPLSEEFGDYATKGVVKTLLEEAGFKITATGALDKRQKGVTKSGGLDMRIKFNKELVEQMRLKNTVTRSNLKKSHQEKQAAASKHKIRAATGITISKKKRSTGNNAQSPTLNTQALALKDILNMTLSDEILSRMQLPALRNRTGRFRDSAEVVNTFMGPRGGLTIDYTYMKYPYQTFEPGFKQGSTNRDPRRIIGASIREIVAANMKGMQPLIRRV